MNWRIGYSIPLPLFLLMCFSVSLAAQTHDDPFGVEIENPFGDGTKQVPQAPQVDAAQSTDVNIDKVKAFNEQMQIVQDSFAKMAKHEAALSEIVRRLLDEAELQRLANGDKKVDEGLKDLQAKFNEKMKGLETQLAVMRSNEKLLKEKIASLQQENSQAKKVAEEAVANRNDMHQTLFEELLNSDLEDRQQLALNHLLACLDKYGQGEKLPVNAYTPEVLRRLSRLVESDDSNVRLQASRCLFSFKPDSAIEMGIQFGPRWRPLEAAKADIETKKIWERLAEKIYIELEDSPLVDLIEDMQQNYRISFRLSPDIDSAMSITYKSNDRTLETSLFDLLDKYDMSFAVIDGEIQVMKKTNAKLRTVRTYRVSGLISEKTDIQTVMKVAQQAVGKSPVEITVMGTDVIVAKGLEADQRRISEGFGTLAPPAKW